MYASNPLEMNTSWYWFSVSLYRFSWRYQLREFKSEFRVVAIDMRGYGESDLPLPSESYRFEYLVTDVKDIVEYLGKAHVSGIWNNSECVDGELGPE